MTTTEERPVGFGRMPRKEDARFVRGHGTYVDDVRLPGMLYGAILRSPLAHARIVSVDTGAAEAHPKVKAVITGQTLAGLGLAWMPTLSYDTQAVLATDKVRFQGQEVAFVVAEDRYAARDALELIDVEYEPLPPVVDARRALDPDAPVIRDDKEHQSDNHIFDWSAGDKERTDEVFAAADIVVEQDMLYPRVHPAPLETCGTVADMDAITGKLTVWSTTQAPHAHRTIYAMVAGIPEHKIRIISPDIGGGFGNKVGIYPGYVCAVVGSIVTGKPVKWVEDRSENLMSTSFARDYHMHGEIAATKDGKILGLRVHVIADHGAFNATAQPTQFPAGFFGVFTGSYDLAAAHCTVTGVYTDKAPGGVAYACSFRVTEAVYLVERMVDVLADRLGTDPAALRMRNLLRPGQFPYKTQTGWEYDSGDYPRALRLAMDIAHYEDLRREQAEKRERGELMGIGVSFFTEAVGAGPRRHMDILGLGMADGAELRVHPTGKAVLRISVQTQGQGHETTFAQIVAEELGIPPEDVDVVHGDTDQTPFGLGTYGSRSTPVSGAAAAMVARKVRERAKIVASAMLEVSPDDLEWEKGRWYVTGDPDQGRTMTEIALAAHSNLELPEGVEGHLDATCVYNPPNLTFPFGAYICVVDVDADTGQVKVRRFIAVDDCGNRINPMIVEGQVHGGLADGLGMALMQVIAFDEDGNCLGGSFMDYLLPTSVECPSWELGETVTPSPHHPIGAKGVGESATVGSPAAVVNAVVDALKPLGVRHVDMPLTPAAVWRAAQGRPLRTDLAIT
ncbi:MULTISPECIES: aerobic carbon-monoxide dehydrogenase large subunit [Streptomyces]|uniref:Aerobic carbon-monoxide dehydrogenase large subunit n=1 Tax=Streptomyces mirabilis TaxID=68239 RepID=A0ABU3UEW0_9ACTN|nr:MULTISPECIES: aerobic carbon-monoxide dehydrogenase large subunit [Streptomyces]MCX4613851.1 aerobic carbon-monoxide dehydrogenase large subunit [Streptomyces mirabilis]MCX5353978.1 aerobic carbon-monoxide dehydrogenase large subunit [Streptomyces mirabilis]MDU8992449.1 aerobic carbon-monoxide dehydrogenase large subunit [Streptomyces mirabilis]NMI62676.1 carbon-monoxide dehydrogenase large subunit [Streptomyces sp. RLA2-12]QDN61654.1 carbon-monoxide dehydrogenase large subunit [Streptomyce